MDLRTPPALYRETQRSPASKHPSSFSRGYLGQCLQQKCSDNVSTRQVKLQCSSCERETLLSRKWHSRFRQVLQDRPETAARREKAAPASSPAGLLPDPGGRQHSRHVQNPTTRCNTGIFKVRHSAGACLPFQLFEKLISNSYSFKSPQGTFII